MHIYHSLLDIILYFIVAGLGMTFFALAMTTMAYCLESTQKNDREQESHLRECLRLEAPSPNLITRQPITDQEEEIRIQKQLAEERKRLSRLSEKNSSS